MNKSSSSYPVPLENVPASLVYVSNDVKKCGMIKKKSGGRKKTFLTSNYDLRFVIINKGWVYYYKEKKSKEPQGRFSLEGFSSRVMYAEEESSNSTPYVFKLYPKLGNERTGNARTWYFATDSESEMKEWMSAFQSEIEQYNYAPTRNLRTSKSCPVNPLTKHLQDGTGMDNATGSRSQSVNNGQHILRMPRMKKFPSNATDSTSGFGSMPSVTPEEPDEDYEIIGGCEPNEAYELPSPTQRILPPTPKLNPQEEEHIDESVFDNIHFDPSYSSRRPRSSVFGFDFKNQLEEQFMKRQYATGPTSSQTNRYGNSPMKHHHSSAIKQGNDRRRDSAPVFLHEHDLKIKLAKPLPPLPEPPTSPANHRKPLQAMDSFPISPPPMPPTNKPEEKNRSMASPFSPDPSNKNTGCFNFSPMPQPGVLGEYNDLSATENSYDDNSVDTNEDDEDSHSYESAFSGDDVDNKNQTKTKPKPPPVPSQKPVKPYKNIPPIPTDSRLENSEGINEKQQSVLQWKNRMTTPSNTGRNLPLPKSVLSGAKLTTSSSLSPTSSEQHPSAWLKKPLKSPAVSNTDNGKNTEDMKLNTPSPPWKKYEETKPDDASRNTTSTLTHVEGRGQTSTEPSWKKTQLKSIVPPTPDKPQTTTCTYWKRKENETPVSNSSHQSCDEEKRKPNFRLSPGLPRKNTYQLGAANPKILIPPKSQNETSPKWKKDRSYTTSPSGSPSHHFRKSPSPTRKSAACLPRDLPVKPPNVKSKPPLNTEQQKSPSHQSRPRVPSKPYAPPTGPKPTVAPKGNQRDNSNVVPNPSHKSSPTPNKNIPPPLPSTIKPKSPNIVKPKAGMSHVELIKSRFGT